MAQFLHHNPPIDESAAPLDHPWPDWACSGARDPSRDPPRIALVVPCFNEDDVLRETISTLLQRLDRLSSEGFCLPTSFVVFVDDGSSDQTWEIIERASREQPQKLRGVRLAVNGGHQGALVAGLEYACERVDASVTLDADLQDDIGVLDDMITAYRRGAELVLGVRRSRHSDGFLKRCTAALYYRLLRRLGVRAEYQHADFRLMSKAAMRNLRRFPERQLFLRGFPRLLHNRIAIVEYDRKERRAGVSKYSFVRMAALAWDGVTSFSVVPLRLVGAVGAIVFLGSAALTVYALVGAFSGRVVAGWASITVPLYLLGGLIMLSIGILGEYVGKLVTEVKRRPRYLIDALAGDND